MTWIKVCGVTSEADAEAAVAAGVSAIGLVFAPSPRRVSIESARRITECVRGRVELVGVFKQPDDVVATHDAVRFDRIQIHHTAALAVDAPVLRAFAPEALKTYTALEGETLVIDGSEGRGLVPDWTQFKQGSASRFVLAGGFAPDTVGEVVAALRPFGVDVSSGVESAPGRKDPELIARFVAAVRSADARR